MRRIAKVLEQWYNFPGGAHVGVPIVVLVVLCAVGTVGDLALKIIF